MADAEYELPQLIAIALQSQRGELLKALGPTHADEVLKALTKESLIQIMNLIADLIDDRYKLKGVLREYGEQAEQVTRLADDLRRCIDTMGWTRIKGQTQ